MNRLVKISALVYSAYIALSLLVVLPLLNYLVPKLVEENLHRPLNAEIILFNPFTLALEARKLQLKETNDEPFAAVDQLEVNLSLASLLQSGVVLDSFTVDGLTLHIKKLPGNKFNFSDMLADDSEAEADAEPASPLPGITIGDLNFNASRIQITDEDRAKPYQTHWDNLNARVQDLSTIRRDGKPYQISVSAEQGGLLTWEGDISIPDGRSSGRLSLSNVRLRTAWRFLEPWLALELRHGRLDIQGDYEVSWLQGLEYRVSGGELAIRGLDIAPKDEEALPDTGLTLTSILLDGVELDGNKSRVDLDKLTVDSLAVAGFMEESRISLAELLQTSFDTDEEETEEDQDTGDDSPWKVHLKEFEVIDSSLAWRSEFTQPETMVVSPISLRWRNIAWPLEGRSEGELSLMLLDTANFSVEGGIELGTGSGTLQYSLAELPVPWFNPNLPKALKANISKGQIQVNGALELADFAPVRAMLDGTISDFSLSVAEEETSLTGWEEVRLEGLVVDIPSQVVELTALHLQRYSGRLHIKEDGSINTQRLLEDEAAAQQSEAEEPAEPSPPWTVKIAAINIADSEMDFMDESLPLKFRTIIGQLQGEILGLDTTPGSRMEIDIDGSVDGYAPVILLGSASPFNELPAIDLRLTFEGVDLARLTPYSGAYAGYAIDRGLLNLDLKYGLENNQLQGDNQIIIDQLKLGEKIESEQAPDLPIQLALALLTDANGVIDLALPVSGDVNDPEFSVGGIVAKALFNLITSAVTAPFKLLAGLVSSDEDLQSVIFPSGVAILDEAGQTKLSSLAEAMQQRPELTLIIKGRLHPTADRLYLQQSSLSAELLEEGLTNDEIKAKSERYIGAVERRYLTLGIEEEALPSLRSQLGLITANIQIDNTLLEALAQERAAATKRYLVNEAGLPASSSVIEQPDIEEEGNRFSGVEMSLDT
ncbi:MAG: DUF748 domain-containing protein [Halioglobus sp.]